MRRLGDRVVDRGAPNGVGSAFRKFVYGDLLRRQIGKHFDEAHRIF
jgi:hypothetical protein